jgi:hypothetical protein
MIDGPQNQSLANLSSAQAVEVKLGPSPWAPMTYMMTSGNTCGTALYKHSTPMTLRSFGRFRQKPDNAKRVDNIHRPNRIDRCQHKGRSRAQPVSGSVRSAPVYLWSGWVWPMARFAAIYRRPTWTIHPSHPPQLAPSQNSVSTTSSLDSTHACTKRTESCCTIAALSCYRSSPHM